jgi:hypothetical protein
MRGPPFTVPTSRRQDMTYIFRTYRFIAVRRTIGRLLAGALAVGVALWGAVALVTTVSPVISLGTGVLILACGLTFLLIHRSHVAHDRAIVDNYPSFGPALARRRAEGRNLA